MRLGRTLQGAVLCALLFMVYSEESDQKNAKRRKCRCKKYIDKLNKDIDKRFEVFENMFKQMFTNKNQITNSTSDIQNDQTGQKLNTLSADMNTYKDKLQKECQSLRKLQENMYSQEKNIDNLNKSFKSLESVVQNLTAIMEKLEKTVKNSIEMRPQTWDPPRIKHHKKPKNVKQQEPETYPKDCDEFYQSGSMKYLGDYYIMMKPEKAKDPFKCVCKDIDGSGWTVIQRRIDGRENFSRDWEDYKNGFGNLQNEFWLGNEKIHLLTTQKAYMVRIDMEEMSGNRYYAEYDHFRISGEEDSYRLQVSGYDGNAGDSLTPYWRSHDGMPFSTRDRDNDNRFYDNCAEHYGGGWWYNDCFESHLNGRYYQNGSHNNYFVRNGIQWNSIHSYSSLKFVEIRIKPSDNAKLPNEI